MAPRLLPFPAGNASGVIDNAGGIIRWYAFRETSGVNPAIFDFYDGSGAGGQLLLPFSLAAGQSARDFVGSHLVPYYVGLYINVISGTFSAVMQGDDMPNYGVWVSPVTIIGEVDVQVQG